MYIFVFALLYLCIFVFFSFVFLHLCFFVLCIFVSINVCISVSLYHCIFGLRIFVSLRVWSLYFNCLYIEAGRVVFVIYYEMAHFGKCIRVRTDCTICVHIICTLFPSTICRKENASRSHYTFQAKSSELCFVWYFYLNMWGFKAIVSQSQIYTMKIKMQNPWHDDLWHLSIWGKCAFY